MCSRTRAAFSTYARGIFPRAYVSTCSVMGPLTFLNIYIILSIAALLDCFSILLSRSRFHHFPNKRSHSYSIGKTKFLCIVLDCHVSFYSYSLSAFCSHYTFNSVLCNLNLRWQKCLSKHLFKKCCVASQDIDKHKTMGQKLPSLLSDEIPIWRMCDFADCVSKVHTKEEYSGYNPS